MDSLDNILMAINIPFKWRDTVKFCRRVGECGGISVRCCIKFIVSTFFSLLFTYYVPFFLFFFIGFFHLGHYITIHIENWVWNLARTRTHVALFCMLSCLVSSLVNFVLLGWLSTAELSLCGYRNPEASFVRGCYTPNHPTVLASR